MSRMKMSAQNITKKLVLALAISALLLATAGCTKLRARDQLNKGVQAYKSSHFEQAVEHFKNATELDPDLTVARLYLATAYVALYAPGGASPENVQMAKNALEQYQKVLGNDSNNITSTKGIASLYFNMKEFEKAKEFNKRAIALDPNDPENYYSVAVIDWTQSYVPRTELRQKLGLKGEEPIKDKKACAELATKNQTRVDEGVRMLEKSIELRKDYDDAMAYLNLMYRERADLHCDDADARAADLKLADEMVEKTLATKKAKAEKQSQQGGIVLDQQQ